EERVHVTRLLASETVVDALGGVDRHRRGLLLVERADRHVGAPRAFDLRYGTEQLHEIRGLADPVDVVTGESHVQMIRNHALDPGGDVLWCGSGARGPGSGPQTGGGRDPGSAAEGRPQRLGEPGDR